MSKHYAEITKKMINDLTITEYIDNEIKLMEERINEGIKDKIKAYTHERIDALQDKLEEDLNTTIRDLFRQQGETIKTRTLNYIVEALMNN